MNFCFLRIVKFGRSTVMILLISLIVGFSAIALFPTFSDAQSELKTFVTHSGAIVQTTGEIIDPLYTVSTVEFDPMEYLREFNYGKVSTLPDGTTLREYTIIAEDDKIMEVSPGVFYNVWTFKVLQLEQQKVIY
jgi:hypothetical protein